MLLNARYEQIMPMKRVLLGECQHEISVRKIGNGYNVRVFVNGELNQEARCVDRSGIGYTARSLLRWEDKCGNISKFASAARARLNSEF
jgi:hypothetical protein